MADEDVAAPAPKRKLDARDEMNVLAASNGWSFHTNTLDARTGHSVTRYRRTGGDGLELTIEVWRIQGRIIQADLGSRVMRGQTYGKRQAVEKALRAEVTR